MPYTCTAGDENPVIIHLQQLDGDYQSADFCADHWAEFVVATALTMGLVYADESTEFEPGKAPGPEPDDDGAKEAEDGPEPRTPVTVPEGAATEDQRPDQDDPAPY